MSSLDFNTPPSHVCLLRLSAIGDTCHALAVLRALQAAWPRTRFTWIIGRVEAKLMTDIVTNVEFIIFDKGSTFTGLGGLRRVLRGVRFDLLLDLQLSMRASLVSTLVRAPVKLGFDRARARELQWLFTNVQIAPAVNEHVLDSFMGFVRACGIEPATPRWNVALPAEAQRYAGTMADGRRLLLISPCSSHPLRNWSPQRYAALADHAAAAHGMKVVLTGGRSALELQMGHAIMAAAKTDVVNQIGRDTLPQLLALMAASTALLSPDSGPVHMASMVELPVVGLYAATNIKRVGPYFSRAWCIDKYAEAASRFLGKSPAQLAWTQKIEKPGVMDLIGVEEVEAKLDALLAAADPL